MEEYRLATHQPYPVHSRFGPPMTRPDVLIWACFAHWKEVEGQIARWVRPSATDEAQTKLLW
jgi:hypothetical protein